MTFKERLSFALMPYPVWMWYCVTVILVALPWIIWWYSTHTRASQGAVAYHAPRVVGMTHADMSVIATVFVEAARDASCVIERVTPTLGSTPGSAMLELVATGPIEAIIELVRMAGTVDEMRMQLLQITRHDAATQSVRMTLQMTHSV